MSDEFANSVWGRDWIRLAQPVRVTRANPLIPKARSLTRNDGVDDVTIAPGLVTATVDGQRTTVRCSTWTEKQTADARPLVAGAPDDLPAEVHNSLRERGLPPLSDVESDCTCTGRTRPCVHLLATFFEVARRVDERPRLALLLRGLEPGATSTTTRIPLGVVDPVTFYGEV
ncbi:hypothetical protein [Umezawaea beigongshangensis]|uniref:hypothetical protein n=1 Tax=Umezawaea beigongshangensis TaxID=2780383 RepID=UPI0018F11A21|nr:hypothetical protein [Umezawaea beigongshangensis]